MQQAVLNTRELDAFLPHTTLLVLSIRETRDKYKYSTPNISLQSLGIQAARVPRQCFISECLQILEHQQCQPNAKRLPKCSHSWKNNKGCLLQTDSVVGKCNTKPFPHTEPQHHNEKHIHTTFYYTRGFEGDIPSQQKDLYTFICCLPGARIKNITKKLSSLVQPLDYYP